MKIIEKNKPAAFKDNVYKMFLRYAILPAFSVIFAGLLLIFGLLRYTAIDSSQKLNKSLSSELSYVISSYEEELNTLASQPALVTKPIDTATRVKIFESLYRRSNQLGYHINVYLFDKEMALVLDNANKNLTVVLQRDAAVNWGVFRQMNAEPESIALRVVQDTDKRSARLYLGRTVLDESGIIGYALFTIDSEELRLLLAGIPAQTIITDSFGWVYATNNFDFVDNLSRMSREYESREGYLNLNGADYYLTGSKIMNGKLSVYTVTDVTSLFTAFTWAGLSLVLIFILILFNLVKGASRVADESTGDINIIFAAFEQVKAGNLDNYIFIGSSLEFQAIGEAYNHMIDSLKEQIEKNKEMIEHTAYAQIKQLESQINPPFPFQHT